MNIKHGHCNGTRYIIVELTPRLIKAVKLSGGPHAELLIPRIPMISKDTDFPVPFKRLQFPVLLAYYLTLNRAQDQSEFDHVKEHLDQNKAYTRNIVYPEIFGNTGGVCPVI
eukprot:scaffold149794_cov40-Cyclotella_meneghiniana.AAC.4